MAQQKKSFWTIDTPEVAKKWVAVGWKVSVFNALCLVAMGMFSFFTETSSIGITNLVTLIIFASVCSGLAFGVWRWTSRIAASALVICPITFNLIQAIQARIVGAHFSGSSSGVVAYLFLYTLAARGTFYLHREGLVPAEQSSAPQVSSPTIADGVDTDVAKYLRYSAIGVAVIVAMGGVMYGIASLAHHFLTPASTASATSDAPETAAIKHEMDYCNARVSAYYANHGGHLPVCQATSITSIPEFEVSLDVVHHLIQYESMDGMNWKFSVIQNGKIVGTYDSKYGEQKIFPENI